MLMAVGEDKRSPSEQNQRCASTMYCRVIACDFDGTGAENGRLAPEVSAALGAAQAQGIVTLLVTGRVLEDIQAACADFSVFDAVVAENGAIIWLCRSGRRIQLGAPPPDRFLGELRARNVPFHAGAVIVGTWDRHVAEVLEIIRRLAIDGQLIFNREALMALPSGLNKAVGVQRTLAELGRSERNLIAFGDAENDLPLLAAAEIGVAAQGSRPEIAAQADEQLSRPGGAGIARYVSRLLDQGGNAPTPARQNLVLGHTMAGAPVAFPGSGVNMLVCGDPRSGKSWLAGLVTEQLIERGYRLCVIDPEGDHVALSRRSGVLALGHDLALPPPHIVPRLLIDEPLSVVLNLSSLPPKEQGVYVDEVLCALECARNVTGIPHWILVDEAHCFFHEAAPCVRHMESRTGNFILVTYRPSLIANDVQSNIGAYLITSTTVDEERYFITKLLQLRGPGHLVSHDALTELEMPRSGLLIEETSGARWQVFIPADRVTNHVHHARKYADTRLPDDKAFRFLYADSPTPVLAHNVVEFHNAVRTVPMDSLRHHLGAGDFSRWVAGVLGDEQLADGMRKLERTMRLDALPNRKEILAHIEHHYLIDKS